MPHELFTDLRFSVIVKIVGVGTSKKFILMNDNSYDVLFIWSPKTIFKEEAQAITPKMVVPTGLSRHLKEAKVVRPSPTTPLG
jgi:hypothetical protein